MQLPNVFDSLYRMMCGGDMSRYSVTSVARNNYVFGTWQAKRRRRPDREAEGVQEGRVWGGVVPLPSRLGGLEERRKFPNGVWGRDPAENEFWNI